MKKKRSDIHHDPENANLGTDHGAALLKKSIEKFGFLEPGVLDKNGFIVSGNKRFDASESDEVTVIRHDGKTPIYIQYDDLDLSDPESKAREAAYYLNRTSQLNLRWDPNQIDDDMQSGLNLSELFSDKDLSRIFGQKGAPSEFKEFDMDLETEYCCPKCGYEWSGKPK